MRFIDLAAITRTFFFLLIGVAQVQSGPLKPQALEKRKAQDVYNPRIISPISTTQWTAGAVETVVWDTSDAPPSISNQGHVILQHVAHLAGPFDLRIGQVNVTVPKDINAGTYRIILFGNSGNESPGFYIHGLEASAPPPSNSSEGSGSAESDEHNVESDDHDDQEFSF